MGTEKKKRWYQVECDGEITEHVYYIKLNRLIGLLYKMKQESKIIVSRVRKEARRQDQLISKRVISVDEKISDFKQLKVLRSRDGHFLHTLSAYIHGIEDVFAISRSLTDSRFQNFHFPSGLRLRLLTWLYPCEQHTFTYNFTNSRFPLLPTPIFFLPFLNYWCNLLIK